MAGIKIIIADCSLALAPTTWLKNEKINSYKSQYNRMPIIDASIHQHLLADIPLNLRLDRPDILHFGLLTLLGYSELISGVEIFFTCKYGAFKVNPKVRLPRSQKRFYGILENLFIGRENRPFISSIKNNPMTKNNKIIFSSYGRKLNDNDLLNKIFVFGGFPRGKFKFNLQTSDQIIRLAPGNLDLWTSISLFLNSYLDFHDLKV